MRSKIVGIVAVLACVATPVLAYETNKPVQVNTDGLQRHVAAQVQKHADESLKSLMEYLWFTRKMNNLWIDDVTRQKSDVIAARETPYASRPMVTRTTGLR